jgi:dTDP-4-dehydrorhamnose 3,5-epimerase
MFDLKPSKISGCFELQPKVFEDTRGRFVKVFHDKTFATQGLETNFSEEFYSVSHKNVIRGLHFQLPPMDGIKMVYCVAGKILDAVVDLRVGSPTYGQFELFKLSSTKANIVYIPKGVAHGFCVLSEQAILVYKVSTVYSPLHDSGVLWNSVGIPWPTTEAILSARDATFSRLDEFISPFCYE